MAGLFSFIAGYKKLSFHISSAAEILNLCMRRSLVYRAEESDGESFTIVCSLRVARIIEKYSSEVGIKYTSDERGIPRTLGRYRHRYGIFIGALVAALVIFFSGTVLWEIQIEGEDRLSEAAVLEELRACGVEVGTPLSRIKTDTVQNKILERSDDISWIAINLIGTVAHVEIREHVEPSHKTPPRAANLVAECDGQIELFEEVRGNIVSEIGDFVREGELLVSGVFDSDALGFRYMAAEGKVLARVTKDFHIEIPMKFQKKVYTERTYTEKYLIFFSKEIKIYSNCRNLPPKCDTIDVIERASVFGSRGLPFAVRTVSYLEYDTVDATRSPEEAIELSLAELKNEIFEAQMGDVLRKKFKTELTEDAYLLDCTVESVKNIAKQGEIEVAE